MDGGGRLLRSLGEVGDGFFPQAYPRFAGPFAILAGTPAAPAAAGPSATGCLGEAPPARHPARLGHRPARGLVRRDRHLWRGPWRRIPEPSSRKTALSADVVAKGLGFSHRNRGDHRRQGTDAGRNPGRRRHRPQELPRPPRSGAAARKAEGDAAGQGRDGPQAVPERSGRRPSSSASPSRSGRTTARSP